jgi:sugar phosphate isomerase/epimerase
MKSHIHKFFQNEKLLPPKKCSISISTVFDYTIPFHKQIPMIRKAGFTHVSLGADESHSKYLSGEGRRRIKTLLKESKLSIDTIHAPSGRDADLSSVNRDIATNTVNLLKETAIAANDLSVPTVIVHASPFEFGREELNSRLKSLNKIVEMLVPIAEELGVKFALENVHPGPATELIQNFLESSDSSYIGFCYDSSHDQIDGPKSFDLLNRLKHKLITMHISDRIKPYVDHVIPGEGFIDWNALCELLKTCNLKTPLLLEVMIYNSNIKNPDVFLETAYRRACYLYNACIEG